MKLQLGSGPHWPFEHSLCTNSLASLRHRGLDKTLLLLVVGHHNPVELFKMLMQIYGTNILLIE
jgi:hypothetical protein